jgi:hypothetical protein
MKKIFAAVALFLGLGFTATAQEGGSVVPSIDPNAPEMKFETEVVDFGTVKFDANGVREFKIKNVGKSPLTISNVQGQCGCTATTIDGKPGWPQEPILPGKSASIKVKYDTKRPGPFEKNVTITSNAKEPSKVVKIKGVVESAPVTPTPATPDAK